MIEWVHPLLGSFWSFKLKKIRPKLQLIDNECLKDDWSIIESFIKQRFPVVVTGQIFGFWTVQVFFSCLKKPKRASAPARERQMKTYFMKKLHGFQLLSSRTQYEESVSTLCAINKPHVRFVYERWWARGRSELKQTESRNAAQSGFPQCFRTKSGSLKVRDVLVWFLTTWFGSV